MKTKKNKKKRSQKHRHSGGKAIAYGSSGCVFSPALKCREGESSLNKVSKLMKNREANKEYDNIVYIRSKLSSIPNFEDYFLLDAEKCKPLPNITKFSKCKKLFTDIENINERISEFTVITMLNGGPPIDDYIYNKGSFQKIYDVHLGLARLLVNGIIPMNQMNIFHCDIKDSNVLIDRKRKVRLIDWGLYTEYTPGSFPQVWRNRPIQFNVPFSVILFTDSFNQKYANYKKEGGEFTEANLKPFVTEYVKSWMEERGAKQYDFIKGIVDLLFVKPGQLTEPEQQTMEYIVNYNVKILVHYKENWMSEYLNNDFTKIVDIWGLIIAYYPILEVLSNSYTNLTKGEMKIFNQLQFIIVNYLYEPEEPMDISVLFDDLDILGKLIHMKLNGSLTTYESPFSPSLVSPDKSSSDKSSSDKSSSDKSSSDKSSSDKSSSDK
jgi:serine/threonine protein kinase